MKPPKLKPKPKSEREQRLRAKLREILAAKGRPNRFGVRE
jgi:hypothetical protein